MAEVLSRSGTLGVWVGRDTQALNSVNQSCGPVTWERIKEDALGLWQLCLLPARGKRPRELKATPFVG